jgi:hypothetical protein
MMSEPGHHGGITIGRKLQIMTSVDFFRQCVRLFLNALRGFFLQVMISDIQFSKLHCIHIEIHYLKSFFLF